MILSILSNLGLSQKILMILALIYSLISGYLLYKYNLFETRMYGWVLGCIVLVDLTWSIYRNYRGEPAVPGEDRVSQQVLRNLNNSTNANASASASANASSNTCTPRRSPLQPTRCTQQSNQTRAESNKPQQSETVSKTVPKRVPEKESERVPEMVCNGDLCYRRAIDVREGEISEGEKLEVKGHINIQNEESLVDNTDENLIHEHAQTDGANSSGIGHLGSLGERPGMGIKIVDSNEEQCPPNRGIRIEVRDL